ncbi:YggS family pyridoxal phosphate enzyme [Prolixibacter bellariivorans]|uniref:Pyridoxal phosphate homeostasis protein n=1 Tax=Prolixibacter bellariivorans TaxID=314319 RepID=A0A5M4AUY3_9BACT|nr:YggS family pyridoxal phosphate-dependent enzyme [Prolixibacter bellariivorans]GET31759.1 YggS family pyridoxal phosphate enzyme [Prolixibacter bellariivorans]
MSIAGHLTEIRNSLPENVKLVAVSKTKPNEDIMEAYQTGQRIFGENKVQELVGKYESLPKDIEWHMIGHLQRNKVKYIAPFVSLIHGVDSFRLLKAIDKEGRKQERVLRVLLQFHIAEEQTKFGLSLEEAEEMLNSQEFKNLQFVRIDGVMGMATFTDVIDQVRREFKSLSTIFGQLKETYFSDAPNFSEISMGMSGDYKLAVEEGSTMVRIGSNIFGERNYQNN